MVWVGQSIRGGGSGRYSGGAINIDSGRGMSTSSGDVNLRSADSGIGGVSGDVSIRRKYFFGTLWIRNYQLWHCVSGRGGKIFVTGGSGNSGQGGEVLLSSGASSSLSGDAAITTSSSPASGVLSLSTGTASQGCQATSRLAPALLLPVVEARFISLAAPATVVSVVMWSYLPVVPAVPLVASFPLPPDLAPPLAALQQFRLLLLEVPVEPVSFL